MWVELVAPTSLNSLGQRGIGVAPFPAGPGAGATTPIELENAFAISAGADRPDAAWQFIDFLLRYKSSDAGAPVGASAQPAASLSAEWGNREMLAAYEFALSHAQRAAPLRREEYIAREALVDAVARLALGERDAEQVLRDAQAVATARIGQ
jgi:ABC-type glycerol-3-phosphate transport system substrate-binding protein